MKCCASLLLKAVNKKSNLYIYDSKGRHIKNIIYNPNLPINISFLEKGFYFLKIKGNNFSYQKKLIKQ